MINPDRIRYNPNKVIKQTNTIGGFKMKEYQKPELKEFENLKDNTAGDVPSTV